MSALREKLYTEAMTLPKSDRMKLVCDLLESPDDGEFDSDAEVLWDAEIDKRIAEIDAGKVVGLNEDELWEKLRAEFKWPA